MYIMTQDGKQIINSNFVARFALAVKPDATLIVASYLEQAQPVTLARYAKDEDPFTVFANLIYDLASDKAMVHLQDSRLMFPEKEIKDARVKRKGGS